MSVRRAQEEIDSHEFTEWLVLMTRVEPFGPVRGDLQAGIISAAVRNSMRGPDSEPFHPKDFLPDFDVQQDEDAKVKADAEAARLHMHMLRMMAQQEKKKSQRSGH